MLVSADPAVGPGGNSVGTVMVDKTGRLVFIGSLADGSKAMQSTYVSANGQWPLYIPLYGGQGFLFSQVSFQNTDTTDLSGALAWYNGGNNGFSFTTSLSGSAYHPPQSAAGTTVLTFTNAIVSLNSPAWGGPVNGQVLLSPKGRMTGQNGFKATGGFAAKNGLLAASVADPSGKGTLPLHGVALQKQNMAAGFFSGHNQTGSFLLQAAPPLATTTSATP